MWVWAWRVSIYSMVWWEDIKQTGERETKRRVFFFIDRSICFDYDSKLGLNKKKKKKSKLSKEIR